jgi:DNA-binding NarL/FixJ family response regulator
MPMDEVAKELDDLQVLLVEDSALICDLIATIVNQVSGVTIARTVESEADAIDALKAGDIDVVVLDLQLREGNGFGVMRALNRMPQRPDVVVLTNFALATYRQGAMAMGVRYFLDKSRDYDRLPAVLREIAETRH